MRHYNFILGLMGAAFVRSKVCTMDNPVLDLGPSSLQIRQLEARQVPVPKDVVLFIHVVAASKKPAEGWLTDAQVDRQVAIIKERFQPTGITFNHDPAKHRQWTAKPEWTGKIGNTARNQMREELYRGDYRTINLYLRYHGELTDGEGDCPIPWVDTFPNPTRTNLDIVGNLTLRVLRSGCVITQNVLDGGSHEYANLGMSAVHEIGHWFGLFHTFETAANPNDYQCKNTTLNDYVEDTPRCFYLSESDGKCNRTQDSCPNDKGNDPVENYMHYSSDDCYNNFTPGQIKRMYHGYQTWRTNVTIVPRPI